MGARPPWKPSSVPHRVLDGGTRRSSKIWTPCSTGGSAGSARNIPSTTTALIDQDTLQCPQNARETETYNIVSETILVLDTFYMIGLILLAEEALQALNLHSCFHPVLLL